MMEQVEFGEVLQDIIQLYRWQYLKQEVKPRPFLYEMAYFLAQSSLLQRPEISNAKSNTKQYREMIEMCTWLLAMDDCPAMETIQLQVNMEAVMRSELNFLSKDERQWRKTVGNMIDDILKIKVVDKRETNKVVDELHSRLLQLVIETSKQIAENPSPCLYQGAEIYAALNSVFPRTSSPYWMDLSDSEKVSQLQELSNIVPGIRMYNRTIGKGGTGFVLPSETFEKESQHLLKKVEGELQNAKERANSYTQAICLHIHTLGINHVLMQRLRDELIYELQSLTYLKHLECIVSERYKKVKEFSNSCSEHLQLLQEMIGSHKCIPNELVYPELEAIGRLQMTISNDLKALRAQSRVAASLLKLSAQPAFKRTPTGLASLTSFPGLAKLRTTINFCGFLPTDIYTVDSTHTDSMFMEAPFSFLAKVEIVARMLPHLVNILRLHGEPRFSQLAISNIIDAVDRQPILCEFSTQTATHILPPHQWDEETLFKRALQLASKQTHSAQTNLSCFRRDSYAQVWRLKEKDTQSPFCGSTTMPKRVKYFENLRGPPNCKFNVVDITLEV